MTPGDTQRTGYRVAAAANKAWRWISADDPLRGVGSILAAELLLTAALAFSAPDFRHLPGVIYLYLFVILWAAFRWGFLHAVFGTACIFFIQPLWLSPGLPEGPFRLADDRHLIIFALVALGISAILSTVRRREQVLQHNYEAQREVAVIVQRALFPAACEVPGYDVAFSYHPASRDSNMGGDFLDVFNLTGGRYGILLGDVTGHGVEASVQTAEIRYGIRSLARLGLSPAECIQTIDEILSESPLRERYATAFMGVIDTRTHILTYCSAGHEPGLLWRATGGSLEELSNTGVMLGLGVAPSGGIQYNLKSVSIGPGDGLALYSDGIPEACGPSERYGRERLDSFILRHKKTSAANAVTALHSAVESFAKGDLRDDVAVLWIRRILPHRT